MESKSGRIMGVDFGTRRIGIAVTDESGLIAQPCCVIKREGTKKDIEKISRLVQQYSICEFVVGIPYADDGGMTEMGEKALRFGNSLREQTGLPVSYCDETLSSRLAEEALLTGGVKRDRRREEIDKIAAVFILRDYLRKQHEKEKV